MEPRLYPLKALGCWGLIGTALAHESYPGGSVAPSRDAGPIVDAGPPCLLDCLNAFRCLS